MNKPTFRRYRVTFFILFILHIIFFLCSVFIWSKVRTRVSYWLLELVNTYYKVHIEKVFFCNGSWLPFHRYKNNLTDIYWLTSMLFNQIGICQWRIFVTHTWTQTVDAVMCQRWKSLDMVTQSSEKSFLGVHWKNKKKNTKQEQKIHVCVIERCRITPTTISNCVKYFKFQKKSRNIEHLSLAMKQQLRAILIWKKEQKKWTEKAEAAVREKETESFLHI